MENNIFGPDDLDDGGAFDCCIIDEVEKEVRGGGRRPEGGCLGLILLLAVPAGAVVLVDRLLC